MNNSNPYSMSKARIVRRYNLTEDVKFFQVRPCASIALEWTLSYKPGQFMMMSIPGVGEAPFSISSSPSRPGLFEFCIRKVGTVTSKIFELKENEFIWLRGPYGNGFPVEEMRGHNLLIIVGGLGAAPLRSLLLYALDNREMFKNVYFLHGAKKPSEMLFRDEFLMLKDRDDLHCYLTVDEDDTGKWPCDIGVVTELFKYLKDIDPNDTYAAVCGPPVMYRYVISELNKLNIPQNRILMTLERRMKCGIGKCGQCVVEHKYICVDGPVFTYWDVKAIESLI